MLSVILLAACLSARNAKAADAVIAPAGNACPDDFAKLTSAAACRAAIDLVGENGEEYNGDEDDSSWPAGCYFCDGVNGCTDGFWFNEHEQGAAKGDARPVCGRGLEPLGDTTSILFLGDSDVDYWDTTSKYQGSHNVGVGGYTCNGVKKEMDKMLDAFGPLEWAVLVCGENDLAYGKSVSKAFSRFQANVDKAVATGARLLYMGTKPEPSTKSLWSEYREYDARVRAYATRLAGETDGPPPLVMVDVYPAFEARGNPKSLYRGDKLHLSGDGYALWNEWARLALDDSSCVRWLDGTCDEFASGDGDTCSDDSTWRVRKKRKGCEWVNSKKPKKLRKRCEKKGSGGVRARVACCATCAKV